jgi:hypothetical protein
MVYKRERERERERNYQRKDLSQSLSMGALAYLIYTRTKCAE